MIDDLLRIACNGAADALAVIALSCILGGIFVGAVIVSLF